MVPYALLLDGRVRCTWHGVEIGAPVLRAVLVVPEHGRHAGEGAGADKIAALVIDRAAAVIPAGDGHPQAAALDLATVNRQGRVVAGKQRTDVRPT